MIGEIADLPMVGKEMQNPLSIYASNLGFLNAL